LPEMGVEEGAFASGPVLRGDGAQYFFVSFLGATLSCDI